MSWEDRRRGKQGGISGLGGVDVESQRVELELNDEDGAPTLRWYRSFLLLRM
jgi:hypothetical protein